MDTPRSAAPLPDSDELALLELLNERLAALAAEKDAVKALRARLLARIGSKGTGSVRAA